MINLLQETKDVLEENGKTLDDIRWIGVCAATEMHSVVGFYEIPIEVFMMKADRDYDEEFGSTHVNETLVIVGDGWWLERAEYDGSEWWEFKSQYDKPKEVRYDLELFW